MDNQEMKIQTKVDGLFHLHSHNREKHHDRFVKKYEELRQKATLHPDPEVGRLAHEMAEHFRAIVIDSDSTCNFVSKNLSLLNEEIIQEKKTEPMMEMERNNSQLGQGLDEDSLHRSLSYATLLGYEAIA
eukprot:scaffold2596_cov126-Skeletonema_dohrnii-CCMP3373.AAC.1